METIDRIERINAAMPDSFVLCEFAGKTEAEAMVFQTLRACAVNYEKHGAAFSFKSKKLGKVTGGGLGDNPAGYRILLERRWIEEKPSPVDAHSGTLTLDDRPIGIFPTDQLLSDLESHLGIE